MKQLARRAVYRTLRGTGFLEARRLIRLRAGRGWAAVLVFHSIRPEPPEDGTSITRERFRAILGLLRRRYRVLTPSSLLAQIEEGCPFSGREVVITFDDGYLDNYTLAAPLLREFDLPACFFVTTSYIGTRKQFWWDQEKGIGTDLMSWAQVRELSDEGFEIGCHTRSHPDLGREPIASWKRELLEPRLEIEDRIGAPVQHFAYPYGAVSNIRPEWIEAVRESGFRSNFSASNGLVTAGTDPYFVPRIGAAPQRSLEELRIDMDDAW